MMYGHVDEPRHWLGHLRTLAALQDETGGFTEFVPLPFVHHNAPIYLAGLARPGPTERDNRAVHAFARLALHGRIDHVQVSWVKLGDRLAADVLRGGADDMGGTLMEETISRMAGSENGSARTVAELTAIAAAAGRPVRQRTTTYVGEPARLAPPVAPADGGLSPRGPWAEVSGGMPAWPCARDPGARSPARGLPGAHGSPCAPVQSPRASARACRGAREGWGARGRACVDVVREVVRGNSGGNSVIRARGRTAWRPLDPAPSGHVVVGLRSWSARTHVAWKPSGTRCGSSTRATGPAAMSDASRISTSDRPSRSSVTKLTR